jgi:hypothetical protein
MPEDGRSTDVLDPADTRRIVARVPAMTADEVAELYAAAAAAAPGWGRASLVERGAVLARAAVLLRERAAEITADLVAEMGKTLAEAGGEVAKAADFFEYYASCPPSNRPADTQVLVIDDVPHRPYVDYQVLGADQHLEGDVAPTLRALTRSVHEVGVDSALVAERREQFSTPPASRPRPQPATPTPGIDPLDKRGTSLEDSSQEWGVWPGQCSISCIRPPGSERRPTAQSHAENPVTSTVISGYWSPWMKSRSSSPIPNARRYASATCS